MRDLAHLERMGRELKCPICLSLFSSSVSLTCNHVFCNACIVTSMKSGSNCPVCKLPYRRREIRPAPHMDNLVSIYKSMELASGFNIFVTQNPPPLTKLSDEKNQFEDDNREVRENIFHEKGGSQPSFPTNKRVQVPHSPTSETPRPCKKKQIQNVVKINDGSINNSRAHTEELAVNDKGEPALSPFFWLQEENPDKLSQLSEGDHSLDITPPNVPTFSDIKDSDDEVPSSSAHGEAHGEENVVDLFDSEMFEWTQRPCSPELRTSPIKVKKQVNNRAGRNQGKKSDTLATSEVFHSCSEEFIVDNEKSMNMERKNAAAEALPSVSGAKIIKNQVELKKLNKTIKKTKGATLRKCAKRNADQNFKASIELRREHGIAEQKEANDCSLNLEKTRKRTKKAVPIASATEPRLKKVRFLSDKENMETPIVSELSGPSRRQQDDRKAFSDKTGKPCRKNIREPHRIGSLRSKRSKVQTTDVQKTDKVDANEIQVNKDRSSEVQYSPVSLLDDQESLKKNKPNSNGPQPNKRLDKKGLRNIEVKDSESGEKVRSSAVKIQSTEKITDSGRDSGLDKLTSLKKSHKDSNTKRFQCAFCLSSEDSEVTGEIVHYSDGKLVDAHQNNGSKAIHCHRNCAEWAPNVYFEDDMAFNLEAELARSRRIKCCCCDEKGAALGCYEKSCRKSFHVPCAKQIPQCRWDTQNFVMLCPLHVSFKLPNETTQSGEKRKRHVSIRQTHKQCNEILKQDAKFPQKWNSIATRGKMVICCSALTPEERAVVSEYERLSGVTVLKNWDCIVTHVIASTDENGACKRTLKVLMGILEGKWILNMEWVKASMKAMQTVEEEHYEITVDTHGIQNGPKLGRQRILNKQPKVFEGFEFYIMGDFVASYKKYLQDLVVAGGGILLHRKPIPTAQEASTQSSKQTYIVYSLEPSENFDLSAKNMILNRRKTDAEALATSTGAKAVSNSWVLNSIAACKLMSFPE